MIGDPEHPLSRYDSSSIIGGVRNRTCPLRYREGITEAARSEKYPTSEEIVDAYGRSVSLKDRVLDR
jgi:hypothetical protein